MYIILNDYYSTGLCFGVIINIARTVLFPSPNFKPETVPSKKKRIFLFGYAFALVALASLYYLPFIIDRAAASGSYAALPLYDSPAETRNKVRQMLSYRLWDPRRSGWVRYTKYAYLINDSWAAALMVSFVLKLLR